MSTTNVTLQSAAWAVVRTADGIRFSVSSDRPEKVAQGLAGYVSERCDDVLWPDDASQVRALLEDANIFGAIELYFDRVGDRWDEEQLEVGPEELDEPPEHHLRGARWYRPHRGSPSPEQRKRQRRGLAVTATPASAPPQLDARQCRGCAWRL